MKAPIGWLKDFVDIGISPEELGSRLVSAGFEIDKIVDLSECVKGVAVGRIEDVAPLEGSDSLRMCKVDVGASSPLRIVCGAKNVRKGMKVPVAQSGAILPGGKTIRVGSIRGAVSEGMLCSGPELGLSDADFPMDPDGLFELPDSAQIGTDINAIIGNDDVALDVEITANRPDCDSVFGLAREIAAILDAPLRMPDLFYEESDSDASELLKVRVESPELCPRYMAKVATGIRPRRSPALIRNRLRAVGIRPINNIVDITNYVLVEIGQPMHAFDCDCLADRRIVVRPARAGERITALDGNEYALTPSDLAICDSEKPVAIAGVMGGEYSSVRPDTSVVAFESARFARASVRRTSRRLGLRSESSARFEKGVDFQSQEIGLHRALALVYKYGFGTVVGGTLDVRATPASTRKIRFRVDEANGILGTDIPSSEIASLLRRLRIRTSPVPDSPGALESEIPPYREDIVGTHDIAEEIIRLRGYSAIEPRLSSSNRGGRSPRQLRIDKTRDILVGKGAFEIVSHAFVPPASNDVLGLSPDSPLRSRIALANPLGLDMSAMRANLAYSMLKTIAYNLSRGNKSGRLFEIGRVYVPKSLPLTELPSESNRLAIGLFGADETFYALKDILLDIFRAFGLTTAFERASEPFLHPGASARALLNGEPCGIFGAAHPDVLARLGCDAKTFVAEIEIEKLVASAREARFRAPVSKYPSVERDLALVMRRDFPASELLSATKSACSELLERAEVFDVYEGAKIAPGRKSVAINLSFRDASRTLKDDEINAEIDKILTALKPLGISLRAS